MKKIIQKSAIIVLSAIIMSLSMEITTDAATLITSNTTSQSIQRATVKVIAKGQATIDGVSVRNKNSASGTYLGSLYTGDKVEIVQKMSNNWYKIKYKNGYAYVTSAYIKLDTATTKITVLNTGVVYNTTSLTVRKTSATSSTKLGTLKKGAKVEIVDATSANYYKIKYNNTYGYVNGKYIQLTKGVTVINKGYVYNAATLNVRKTSSTSSTKLGSLKRNAQVQIVGKASNGWYKIKYNTGYGYVSNNYIKITTSSQRTNLDNFLFIGDSFTYGIKDVIKSKNNTVYLSAQSGSRPSYWLDKVGDMASNNNVEGISLLIGTNGVTNTENITDTKELINKLIVKYPDKTIYVQKVFPVGTKFTGGTPSVVNKSITKFNTDIEAFCKTKSNVKFIDTTSGFVSSKGYLTNTSDGLHITSSKSTTFYNNIFKAIKSAETK